MLPYDPSALLDAHREQLMREVEQRRVLAQLPRRQSRWRQQLAVVCLRAADWLDGPCGTVRSATRSGTRDLGFGVAE